MEALDVDGAWLFTPHIHRDKRGSFLEWFKHAELGVHPLDPAIGIAWPEGLETILSDKDAAAPSLTQARAAGLLPDFAGCQAYAARLQAGSGG